MTKDAIKQRELAIQEDHNLAMEKEAHRGNTINAITGTLNALTKLIPGGKTVSSAIKAGKVLSSSISSIGNLTGKDAETYQALLERKNAGERLSKPDYELFRRLQGRM